MKSVNKVILIGNLGKDPEVKFTPQGTPVAKFALATNERFKGKDGQWQDRTEWHNVVLWQRLAEIAGEYLKKGGKVYIEGRLQTRLLGRQADRPEEIHDARSWPTIWCCSADAAKAAVANMPAARAESRLPRAATTSIRARPNRSTRQPAVLRSRTKTFRSSAALVGLGNPMLADRKCVPCHGGVPSLKGNQLAEIHRRLAEPGAVEHRRRTSHYAHLQVPRFPVRPRLRESSWRTGRGAGPSS